MSNNSALQLVIVAGAGLAAYVLYTKQQTKTAAAAKAATAKRNTAVSVGSTAAVALGNWLGSSSGQKQALGVVNSIGNWFAPTAAAAPALDWGLGSGWGDDSTAGAVTVNDWSTDDSTYSTGGWTS